MTRFHRLRIILWTLRMEARRVGHVLRGWLVEEGHEEPTGRLDRLDDERRGE